MIISPSTNRTALLSVRPAFILACIGFSTVLILPSVIAGRPILQRATLVIATIAIGSGWVLLLKHPEPNNTWRTGIALLTAAYLTASIPSVFFELSQWKWLRHPAASLYVRPWVHWGYTLMCLGILGSFCARGRSRMVLVVGSVIIIALRGSMGTWVF
jgi:hypothetical protein